MVAAVNHACPVLAQHPLAPAPNPALKPAPPIISLNLDGSGDSGAVVLFPCSEEAGPVCSDYDYIPCPGCGSDACSGEKCSNCDAAWKVWARAEFLYWWTDEPSVIPLVTSSPLGTAQGDAGVLGRPDTEIVLGGNTIFDTMRPGGRYTIGYYLDDECSLEASYTTIDEESLISSSDASTASILARPFFNVETGLQDARLIEFPGLLSGSVTATSKSDFDAVELVTRQHAGHIGELQVHYLLGYRFTRLDDLTRINEVTTSLSGGTAGSVFNLTDEFDTRNNFHGGVGGLSIHWKNSDRWSFDLSSRMSLGGTFSKVSIGGATETTDAGGNVTTSQGGLLALGTNIGDYERSEVSWMGEFGGTARYRIATGLVFSVGYSFMYWDNVARATDQIDASVNVSQIPPATLSGEARPAFSFETGDFMAHGLRLGLEYRW